ncbi:hypothetical protein CRG98_012101 [Punica granatum]|uniref:Uncharacterized protein n=1 Tax=Punica granatum TaxID=22663 RepID=A0A2I0KG91_PUNGR|nr:hypothetical protein CRG98_012101 [Punica granatum]
MEHARARHQRPSPYTPVPVTSACHHTRARPSSVPVTSATSARHQRHQRSSSSTLAPVTIHTRACLQRPSPAPPAPVTVPANTRHRSSGQDTEDLSRSLPGRPTGSLAFSGFLHNPGRSRDLVDTGYRLR